jgi:DNA repair ATPase RecN
MDQTQLQQQIAEYYQKLPPKAQTAFSSMQWMETLQAIAKKYTLDAQQVQTLGTETTLALLGITSIEQYAKNLAAEIALPKDSMVTMLAEIGDSVFKDIQP